MNQLLDSAKEYLQMGFSVVAVGYSKVPVIDWSYLKQRQANLQELKDMFSARQPHGIAVICGKVSGGLEVVDFDCKHDLDGSLYERYIALLREKAPALATSLVKVRTRSGGWHLYYRCLEIAGNQLLARRPLTEQEKIKTKNGAKVLIETRGEGGIAVVAPTPGYTFMEGRFHQCHKLVRKKEG